MNEALSPEVLATVRLLWLPEMGPARLRWLVSGGSAVDAVDGLRARRMPAVAANPPRGLTDHVKTRWFEAIDDHSDDELSDRLTRGPGSIMTPAHPAWPFADDPEPPLLLFCQGNLELLASRPAVAIVGTRRCTSLGRRVATEMASALAAAGVSVVSGLALGIDGAAHTGALAGTPPDAPARVVGVVATGLDVVYPKRHAALWADVAEQGLLVSEAPPGTAPARWRFPARNRIIAALADLVVVIESHAKGGALSTVDEAIERGISVLAVPGSVLSAASEGSNALLMDGATPVRHGADVLELLGFAVSVDTPLSDGVDITSAAPQRPAARRMLSELAAGSQTFDTLAAVTQQPVGEVLALAQQLSLDDLVVIEGSRVRLA